MKVSVKQNIILDLWCSSSFIDKKMATSVDVQGIRRYLIVHDVDTSITIIDIEEAIQYIIGTILVKIHFGKPYGKLLYLIY